MSYAEASLDLSLINVACLSGHNGSGKSALLDAVTWALWEQARSSSDELVRLGEKEMWVSLVFEYENRIYRVRRSRQTRASKSQKSISKGSLELQVLVNALDRSSGSETRGGADPDTQFISNAYPEIPDIEEISDYTASGGAFSSPLTRVAAAAFTAGAASAPPSGAPVALAPAYAGQAVHYQSEMQPGQSEPLNHWRSLTGPSMRATQQTICNLLRMDYDTFINSAYLRQGRADEFTTRAPSERKQVLSEILGLSYFDRLQEACKIQARNTKLRIDVIESHLISLPEIKERHAEISKQLLFEDEELSRQKAGLQQDEKQVEALNAQVQSLKLMAQKHEQTSRQLSELKSDCENLERQSRDVERRRADLLALIDRSREIEEKAEEFNQIKDELEQLDSRAYKAQGLLERRMQLQSELSMMRSRLEVELEHCRSELSALKRKIETLSADTANGDKISASYQEFKNLLKEESLLAQKQDAFTRLSERMNQLHTIVVECQIKLEAEIGQKEIALSDLDELLKGETLLLDQHQALEQEAKELDRIEAEFELVEQRGLSIKSELEGQEAKVEEIKRRQKETAQKIDELKEHKHSSICPLCSAPIVDRLAVINRYDLEIKSLAAELMEVSKTTGELEEERSAMRNQYLLLKKQLEKRKELDKRIGQFNEKEEAIKRAKDSRDKLHNDLRLLQRRLEDNEFAQIERESLIAVKAEIFKLEFDPITYTNLQAQIRAKRNIESRFQQLKKDLDDLERLEKELPALIEKESALQTELSCESYGMDVREQLKAVKEQLDEINYDREHHHWLRSRLEQMMPFAEQVRDLNRALSEQPLVERSLADLQKMLEEKKAKIPLIELEVRELEERISALERLESELADRSENLHALTEQVNQLARQVAVSQSLRQNLEVELDKLESKKAELQNLNGERDDYAFLADCFGKKGIQAVIIENAVPELEAEANRILSRLSENKMHIALVTQQKNKSGNLSETLDILIGDEIGTRNYELFSGGEAFKINFAIRIALSRLLARRAGARLETLIIDEGFGSQDDASRERLVKAIKSIQPDFQKILVITHISDVREMFPVQIYVTKYSGVSRLQVI